MIPSVNWGRGVAVNMPPCQGGDRGFESRRSRREYLHERASIVLAFLRLYSVISCLKE